MLNATISCPRHDVDLNWRYFIQENVIYGFHSVKFQTETNCRGYPAQQPKEGNMQFRIHFICFQFSPEISKRDPDPGCLLPQNAEWNVKKYNQDAIFLLIFKQDTDLIGIYRYFYTHDGAIRCRLPRIRWSTVLRMGQRLELSGFSTSDRFSCTRRTRKS